mgnify:CR=1 FL=1
MKISNFLWGKRQMVVLGVIVAVLLTSAVGAVSSVDYKELKDKCTEIYRTGGHYESL